MRRLAFFNLETSDAVHRGVVTGRSRKAHLQLCASELEPPGVQQTLNGIGALSRRGARDEEAGERHDPFHAMSHGESSKGGGVAWDEYARGACAVMTSGLNSMIFGCALIGARKRRAGAAPRPPLEGARERSRIREPHPIRSFAHAQSPLTRQLERDRAAYLVDDLLERHALCFEQPVQLRTSHAQRAADLRHPYAAAAKCRPHRRLHS